MWKKKEDGNIAVNEAGNPIWIYSDGQEHAVDFAEERTKINELNEKLKDRTSRLKKYEDTGIGCDNIAEFVRKANANQELIDAGGDQQKIQKRIDEAVAMSQAQVATLKTSLEEKDKKILDLNQKISQNRIIEMFGKSEYVRTRIGDTQLAYQLFARYFEISEDGQIIGKDFNGNKLLNEKGEPSFEFAIMKLVESSPFKDKILSATTQGGAGSGGNRGTGSDTDLSTLTVTELMSLVQEKPELMESALAEISKRNQNKK